MPEQSRFADHAATILSNLSPDSIPSDLALTIEQRILDGDHVIDSYTVEVRNGVAAVVEGVEPDVVISQDQETATALRAGECHAQEAYLTGRLTIDGDVDKLLESGPALQAIVKTMGQSSGDA